MAFSRIKKTSLLGMGLCLGISTSSELLNAPSAQAITPAQRAQAIQLIQRAGCNLGLQGTTARITCSTQSVANLIASELRASNLKLYNSKGKSYARYKIGSNSPLTTVRIPNIYENPTGPPNLKAMPDNLNSRSMTLRGTPTGFRLVTAFESSGTEFQVEDKYFGSWCDNCFPDLHWDNGRVTANLQLTRNMTLSNISNIEVSGRWSIRTGLNVLPDNFMNSKVRERLNSVFQQYLPSMNRMIQQRLKSLSGQIPGAQSQRTTYNFSNGNIIVNVPLSSNSNGTSSRPSAQSQRLRLNKAYRIKDDESWGSHEYKNYATSKTMNVERGATATAFKPSGQSNSPRHCAGGEVRVEDWDRVEVARNGIAKIWVSMELYEGISCSSNDKDGRKIGVRRNGSPVGVPFLVVRPGESKSKTLRVNNTDEGGDYGRIIYSFSNNTLR